MNLFSNTEIRTKELKTARKGFTKSYEVMVVSNDPLKQLNVTKQVVKDLLLLLLSKMNGLKAVSLKVSFQKPKKEAFFNSKAIIILNEKDIHGMLQTAVGEILNKIGSWLNMGSGWTIENLKAHFLNIVKYKQLRGYILQC